MSRLFPGRHPLGTAGAVLTVVYFVGFGVIRVNCETQLSGNGMHHLVLHKPLWHSPKNWDRPYARLVAEIYRPFFEADVKWGRRVYFRNDAGDVLAP